MTGTPEVHTEGVTGPIPVSPTPSQRHIAVALTFALKGASRDSSSNESPLQGW